VEGSAICVDHRTNALKSSFGRVVSRCSDGKCAGSFGDLGVVAPSAELHEKEEAIVPFLVP
jgi:hypothetical protein